MGRGGEGSIRPRERRKNALGDRWTVDGITSPLSGQSRGCHLGVITTVGCGDSGIEIASGTNGIHRITIRQRIGLVIVRPHQPLEGRQVDYGGRVTTEDLRAWCELVRETGSVNLDDRWITALIEDLGEVGNVVRRPVAEREHVGHVATYDETGDLFDDPQGPLTETPTGRETIVIDDHVLIDVGSRVVQREVLFPLFPVGSQAVGDTDASPGKERGREDHVVEGGVEDAVGCLEHHKTRTHDVKVIQRFQESRI